MKNKIVIDGETYVKLSFIEQFITPAKMIEAGLIDFAAEKSAQQSVHPTDGGLALRACVNASCGWVGKESACLTWKHAGDERMCPHCHDNTESIPLSAISG